jgi:hypothetical protein
MNTVVRRWIRKQGVKKLVFLSIFVLVALAYIISPLIALACGNGNGNGGGNNNSSSSSSNAQATATPSGQKQTVLIDSGVYLINKHSIQKTSIAFLQVVGPDHKPITLSQYQQLLQYAATPKKSPVLVRIEVVLLNQSLSNGVFTQGQFITKVVGNKSFGTVVVTTDTKQQLIANPSTKIPLRVPNSSNPN